MLAPPFLAMEAAMAPPRARIKVRATKTASRFEHVFLQFHQGFLFLSFCAVFLTFLVNGLQEHLTAASIYDFLCTNYINLHDMK